MLAQIEWYCIVARLIMLLCVSSLQQIKPRNYFLIDADLQLPSVAGMVFLVGVAMFMVPIVPGTAVYLFSGVVLGRDSVE